MQRRTAFLAAGKIAYVKCESCRFPHLRKLAGYWRCGGQPGYFVKSPGRQTG
jgi:hypothetical protein